MLEVGRIRVHLLNDGFFALDGGAMFGIIPKPLWSKEIPADEQNRIRMSLHCPLATDGSDAILVDTGVGERLSEKEREIFKVDRQGGLRARLGEIGLDPEDVTHVVLTHLHFDHLGGVVARGDDGRLRPAFPRARHFIQRSELTTALAPGDERVASAYRHAAECLEPLREAKLVEVCDGDTEITPRLRVVVTGGHTPSHQCPVLADAGASFIHLGDIAPTRAHLRPAWNQAYDQEPLATIAAKRRLLDRAAAEGWWVSFDHDRQIACGRLGPEWGKGEVIETIPLPSS